MKILVPGLITGIAGFVVGRIIKSSTSAIAEQLKPLQDAVKVLEDIIDSYLTTWVELETLYEAYVDGQSIDWANVDSLKAELGNIETQVDNQVLTIGAIIEGA